MNEPANETAWIDRGGDTWVRLDTPQLPRQWGPWWPLTDGPHWEVRVRDGIGQPRPWSEVEEYGPFVAADPERTARALRRAQWEVER